MKWLDRLLCRLNQHRLVMEEVLWDTPPKALGENVRAMWWAAIRPIDTRGFARTRCLRHGCTLQYASTFLPNLKDLELRGLLIDEALLRTRGGTHKDIASDASA